MQIASTPSTAFRQGHVQEPARFARRERLLVGSVCSSKAACRCDSLPTVTVPVTVITLLLVAARRIDREASLRHGRAPHKVPVPQQI
jgi:hypothetical protein